MHLRNVNIFGFRKYKLQSSKSKTKPKISTISLFEADSDNYSNDKSKSTKTTSCDSRQSGSRFSSSILSGRKSKRRESANKSKKKSNSGKTTRKKLKSFSKMKSRSERILHGTPNKAFTDLGKYREQKEYMLPFEMTSNSGVFCSFVNEDAHSSFRPFNKASSSSSVTNTKVPSPPVESSCVISLCDVNLNKNTDVKELTIIKRDEFPTYQPPWKQCNDYEALETTTATGSVTNLSSITSFSEIAVNKQNPFNAHKLEKHNSNNNEVISRCSKITEELQLKLKERRLITEGADSDSNELDKTKSIINGSSGNETNWHEHDQINTVSSCSCPCHCQSNANKKSTSLENMNSNKNCSYNGNNYYKTQTQKTYHYRQMVSPNSENSLPQTTENSPTILPINRASIRKLMENKAVSENKQKNELERHLTSMIFARLNSCEIVD